MQYVIPAFLLIFILALLVSAWRMRNRVEILAEFFQFLKEQKMWWIMPLALILILAGLFVVVAANSGVGAFLYALH